MKTIVNYAQKVKEQHALNKTLAPVETDLTDASRSYSIGEQFINDGDLFKAKTPIAQHDALVLDTNYEAADDITTQIKNKTVTTDPVPTEGSTNPVQSNGVYVENRNIYKVMGEMGAKALLPMSLADIKAKNTTGTWNNNAYTINGVTFTVNTDSDGFITDIAATGTASADATLMVYGYSYTSAYAVTFDTPVIASIDFVGSGSTARGIVWGTNSAYIEATEVQIAAGTLYGFGLRVLNGYEIPAGGITFKPMVRFASDSDDTYQPYVKTNKELTAENEALTNKLNNEIVTRSELGAKNLLPYDIQKIKALNTAGTWNGNTYTPNNSSLNITLNTDGSITVDGTSASAATATLYIYGSASEANENIFKGMIASGCPSGGATNKYSLAIQGFSTTTPSGGNNYHDIGEGITVGNDNYVRVYVRIQNNTTVSNLTFKPMIRLASDPDATYQPYAKTNQELTAENQTLTNQANDMVNVLGAKNLLLNEATTQILNDVTFTKNSDGSITVNGTASQTTYYPIAITGFVIGDGDYLLTGCPNGGSASKYSCFVRSTEADSSQWQYCTDYGNGATLTASAIKKYVAFIEIQNGQTISNLLFKPMLRPASIEDDTYVPYSMTNREMTPYVRAISNPNLLDNPWFTVNQRGQSSYNSTGYTVDRWYMGASAAGTKSVTVNSDETVTVANEAADSTVVYFFQRLDKAITDKLLNKMVTISVMLSDGTIFSASKAFAGVVFGNITVNGVALGGYRIWINSTTGVAELTVDVYAGKSISIKAIKLELGKVSTLASDTAPNYATELLKCQRYYITSGTSGTSAYGFTSSTTKGYIYIPVAVKMRARPTVESFSGHIYFNGNDLTITSYQVVGAKVNSVQVEINVASGLQANNTLVVSNLTFALSADL